jgi:hypothetical protein
MSDHGSLTHFADLSTRSLRLITQIAILMTLPPLNALSKSPKPTQFLAHLQNDKPMITNTSTIIVELTVTTIIAARKVHTHPQVLQVAVQLVD